MTNNNWTDEQIRYFFHLYANEKRKGNKSKVGMNQTGKEFITNKFEERFGERHLWQTFKHKYDTCRRIHHKYKRLTHNRTLSYDVMGRIEMSQDWWKQRIKEWPGARSCKNKMIPNLDVYADEFGVAQHGDEDDDIDDDGDVN